MIHPDTALRFVSPEIGYGVFATRVIPRGTITWVRDALDQVLTAAHVAALPVLQHETLDKYTFRDSAGNYVLCWDLARYMNHACAPSCLGTGYGFEVAVRDIAAGEELTDDYATLHLQAHESFACHCGARQCRQWIGPEDAVTLAALWQGLFREACQVLAQVVQPLWPLMRPADVRRAWHDLDMTTSPVPEASRVTPGFLPWLVPPLPTPHA
jgi:uncharacterized protein